MSKALLGASSIRYVNEEDKDKSKSKTYRGYGEIPFDLLKSPRTGFAF